MSNENENANATDSTSANIMTPIIAPVLTVVTLASVNHGENLEKFNGINFKIWQQKMLFYMTTLKLARY